MQNLSYEKEFYLHVNENSFSYERLCTKTRFEKEAQDNSEMDYLLMPSASHNVNLLSSSNILNSDDCIKTKR